MEIVCWSSKFGSLLRVWAHPGLVVRMFLLTLALVLLRLLFASQDILPGSLPLNPFIGLLFWACIRYGPAGLWGGLISFLIAEALLGSDSTFVVFRFIGVLMLCWYGLRRHRYLCDKGADMMMPGSMLWWVAAIMAAAADASWTAMGAEVLRLYPFAYIWSLVFAHDLIFILLLGFGLTWLLGKSAPWTEQLPARTPVRRSKLASTIMHSGTLGAAISGLLITALVYKLSPFRIFMLGDETGMAVAIVPGLFLMLEMIGLLMPDRRQAPKESLSRSGLDWRSLMD